jgi:probable phosphoglycerate mutase
MLLYYIRHADPIYRPDSLTPLGERQSESVAKRLSRYGIDRVFSSSSKRAVDTSKPLCEMLKIELEEAYDWCHESKAIEQLGVFSPERGRNIFGYHHRPTIELLISKEAQDLYDNWYDHPYFDGLLFKEGTKRIQKGADDFLEMLGYRHDRENFCYYPVSPTNDRIALFAHQGFGLAFMSAILDIPYSSMCTHFYMAHTGVTVVEFAGTEGPIIPKVLTFSNDSHLYADGLSTKFQNRIYI